MPANGERPVPPPELPRLEETRRFFEAHGDQTAVYGDQGLPLWAATRCLSLAGSDLNGELRELDDGVYLRSSNGDLASYRSLLVCLREPSSLNGAGLGAARGGESRQLDGGSVAAMLATVALSNELRELHRRLEAQEDRLGSARATLARRDAQIEDLSHRLADSLTSLSVERGERELSERDIAAMKKARTWRLMARLYFAAGRLQQRRQGPDEARFGTSRSAFGVGFERCEEHDRRRALDAGLLAHVGARAQGDAPRGAGGLAASPHQPADDAPGSPRGLDPGDV